MNMALSLSSAVGKQVQPLVGNFQGSFSMEQFFRRKEKVVIVMGATGTGKSRLAIDLATRFPAEIVNSDKIQAYEGLDVVTNKVTDEERRGVSHHLLGSIDPNSNFSSHDFTYHASVAIESILARDRLPIVAGGSNSYIEALVDDWAESRFRYEFCFLWVDVSLPILQKFVSNRVDRMVDGGFVSEVREFFDPEGDYSRGIKRAIGVPELHDYLRAERDEADERTLTILLELAISKIKDNTCQLALRQLQKIRRLRNKRNWNLRRLDATGAFLTDGGNANDAWDKFVLQPSLRIVDQFLSDDGRLITTPIVSPEAAPLVAAVSR
ncbi:adenylate isopentenyltransferase 5, chloroplastic-like [Cucurbita pepo subsp. pepo]|uniref:adenylate isopentenyltransferase 5, chloroplastic-like n=1 Tax=Cucurbita pepo subsp. pepo TaxID=3664 RepID=UPI000C9D734F|nr:adenylate isopentenyltransferase 5, chloroplastic-like [Cucurbita pepo subsp. pepo]